VLVPIKGYLIRWSEDFSPSVFEMCLQETSASEAMPDRKQAGNSTHAIKAPDFPKFRARADPQRQSLPAHFLQKR
jgi:hypothetical protein